jgi:SAM-dependent methyltransferase
MAVDQNKLNEFMGKFLGDLGGTFTAALVLLGEKLGLYKAMAGAGPMTPEQLAKVTGTDPRYIREWMCAQAASGYLDYDASKGTFLLTEERAYTLADETSPAYLPGAFQLAVAAIKDEPKITERFRNGQGFGWHEHDVGLFAGTERFFRPNYGANLMTSWIPALDGVQKKLEKGALVADVGCGHGASTILMAQAFPNSEFVGFDYHAPSVERARAAAEAADVKDRVRFEVATAKKFPGKNYDFVAFFDCLHDMGDPVGAASHVRTALRSDGTWMVVEPMAGDKVEENLNPVGRVYYGASTLICTPASRAQEVGLCLGAQAGEARLREVLNTGGFRHVRRAAETPFNLVLEARP